jgi:hypothetical protein
MAMRWLSSLMPSLIAVQPALAAVYGLPEPPTPAPTPTAWLLFSDDFLGMSVLDTDDFRTANISVGGQLDRWRLGADLSMLTNRGDDGSTPSRTDEITLSLGYALADQDQDPKPTRWLVTICAGGRAYGDFKGEEIQNNVHDTFGYPEVHLPYDPEQGVGVFGFYHVRITTEPDQHFQLTGPFGRWWMQLESGGLASSEGELQIYGGLNLVSVGRDSLTWIGTRYQWNGGDHPTATSTIVAEKETGWWLHVGLARTPGVLVTASLNPRRETVAGSLGLSIDHDLPIRVGPGYHVDQALKFFPDGGNLGIDVRWQPSWLQGYSLSQRDTLVLVYDFGAAADYDWVDNTVAFDQLVFGWAPSWNVPQPIPRLIWTVAGYAAAGLRLERVLKEGAAPRYPNTDIATAGVVQGELGTRFGFRFNDQADRWYNQARLGVGIDGWLPVPSATVSNGSDTGEFQRPGYSAHVTLGVSVDW